MKQFDLKKPEKAEQNLAIAKALFDRGLLIILSLILAVSVSGCAGKTPEPTTVQIDKDTAVVSYLGPEGTYTQEAITAGI